MTREPCVGFVGLGNMGLPMAKRVCEAGFPVWAWDVSPAATARFEAVAPGHVAASPVELAEQADIICTMLPTGEIVRDLLIGQGAGRGLLTAARPGAIFVDMSTSNPMTTVETGRLVREAGFTMVDAPVAGGVHGARKGSLSIMIGCDDEDAYRTVEPVLAAMGSRLIRTGGIGAGHATKALNNYLVAAQIGSVFEAMEAGERFGLSREALMDAVNAGTGRGFVSELMGRMFAAGGIKPIHFALSLMAKDVGIAASCAEGVGVDAEICRSVQRVVSAAAARIEGGDLMDFGKYVEAVSQPRPASA